MGVSLQADSWGKVSPSLPLPFTHLLSHQWFSSGATQPHSSSSLCVSDIWQMEGVAILKSMKGKPGEEAKRVE